jgi:hypothetical protein
LHYFAQICAQIVPFWSQDGILHNLQVFCSGGGGVRRRKISKKSKIFRNFEFFAQKHFLCIPGLIKSVSRPKKRPVGGGSGRRPVEFGPKARFRAEGPGPPQKAQPPSFVYPCPLPLLSI